MSKDTIYRQDAIDACIKVRELHAYDEIEEIKHLPSAQPERNTGYIDIRVISMFDGEDCYCSECGTNSLLPSDKFCRKCGVEFIGVRGEQYEIDNCYQSD